MLVPLRWLQEYVQPELNLPELTHLLSMAGLEVDAVHNVPELGPEFVVARITDVQPHPKADRLRLVTVDDGGGGRTVVCGAPNVSVGASVVLAKVGAVLPEGHVIGEAKIRGVKSAGMLCSEVELGRGDDSSGLLILPQGLAPGTAYEEAFPGGGAIIEIGLTPNRPDCLSIRGVGREVSALTGCSLTEPEIGAQAAGTAAPVEAAASVEVVEGDRCSSYVGRVLEGVVVGPSPKWMVDRLSACGLRSINNVVDATNYVMLELGQPLHAFDLDTLAGHSVIVRLATPGETLVTLDGVERKLDTDDLLICDAERPLALAGVMGGEHSGVTNSTTRLLLESACFGPLGVRRTARRHMMHTDSSHRFERGVDPQGQQEAVDRLAQIILQIAGGHLRRGYLRAGPGSEAPLPIVVDPAAVSSLLGVEVDAKQVTQALEVLGIDVASAPGGTLLASPPTARVDLREPTDLAEEVARVIGYDQIPVTLPWAPVGRPQTPPLWSASRRIEDYLGAQGLYSTMTYSFISPGWLDRLGLVEGDPRRDVIRLLKPISEEMSIMRPLVVSSLLNVAAYNANRQNPDLGLFELGRVFKRGEGRATVESDALSILLTGQRYARTWDRPGDDQVDLFDLKGLLEGLVAGLGIEAAQYRVGSNEPWLRTGHALEVHREGSLIGVVGEVAPAVCRAFGLEARAYVAELDVASLMAAPAPQQKVTSLPSQPRTQRDLAVVVGRDVPAAAMLSAISDLGEALIEDVGLFDVYEGKQVQVGSRSVGFSISYRASDRTLTEAEVSEVHGRVLVRLTERFGATLRA